MPNYRPVSLFADSQQIADGARIRIQGRANMTLLPDFFTIDCYNISDDDESLLRRSQIVHANAIDNSMLCYGKVEDIYKHTVGADEIITIGISDGQDFWSAKISTTIGTGTRFRETIRNIIKGATMGSYLAENPRFVRGQTLSGSLPHIVQNMASAVNARAFIRHGALHIVGKGKYNNIYKIDDEEIVSDPGSGNGVSILSVDVKGYAVGAMIEANNGLYRLAAQSIDADNFTGRWNTDLILVNENMINSLGGW